MTTKLYDIIHINNHMYMVDKDTDITRGNRVYNHITNDPDQVFLEGSKAHHWKLIASTDPSFNLPLLPAIEEDILGLLKKEFPDYDNLPQGVKFDLKNGFVKGYKAASSKNDKLIKLLKCCLEVEQIKGKILEGMIKDKLKALNPLPIKVEVEMEYEFINLPDQQQWQEMTGEEKMKHVKATIPKTTNNIVNVIRYIYDN